MYRIFQSLLLIAAIGFVSCSNEKVTLESLLQEMTNKQSLTYFPENEYEIEQFSSYDRKSISPEAEGWWANADYTQFIREEDNNGRREFVMFEDDGPGAIVRFWMTFAGEGSTDGILRFYIDGNEKPVIEGNALEVLSGGVLAPNPLSASVSPETEYERRGHNLYLPIPYAEHCKITIENDSVKQVNNRWRPSIYYNINYRKYNSDVEVESFSKEILERAEPEIEKVSQQLTHLPDAEIVNNQQKTLAENEELTINFSGEKLISKISVQLDAEDMNQALRSTVLSISFDENETVWVPVGDFFGTGYQIHPSKTFYTQVTESGLMKAFWEMPFQNSAKVRVINFGVQNVEVELGVSTEDYNWKNNSMYFGASWHEYNQINTAKDTTDDWHFDVNYVDITGKGVYVGDALTVFNTADAWWGEGDEKIFVDNEEFPSCLGTGTEDYYGYAWCRPEEFTHPFIAQPTGAGNFHPGMTVNMRYRALDAMPFQNEISSNIEMWHWTKTIINYAMTAYYYVRPGFEINVKPEPEIVKLPVALKRSDIIEPVVDENGKIEGEYLEVMTFDSGTVSAQTGNFGWSNRSQLWWRNGYPGDELITKFKLNQTGKYTVSVQLTKAVDYGIIQLYLNGNPIGNKFNGFTKNGVKPVEVNLGNHVLSEGENIFTIKILGSDNRAKPGNMAGIDFLKFQ